MSERSQIFSAIDWGLGHYERTAAALLPAATAVVARAAPTAGERVVDVGCGTGNAALLAASLGAQVSGVDPAPRLLAVAREQAAAQGLDVGFEEGTAAQLPFADGEADVVLSVFGVIFAPDPQAAAAELSRVSAPHGRIVLSAWIPTGAIPAASRAVREAAGRALGAPAGAPPFAWHDSEALGGLLAPYKFEVALQEFELVFTARSPRDYVDGEFEHHPLCVAARALLEPLGEAAAVRDRAIEIMTAANEAPDAFRVTSNYVVASARRA